MMCGQEAVDTIRSNWEKYIPVILELVSEGTNESESEEDRNFKALFTLDKKLRTSGPTAKSPAVFSVYKVKEKMLNILTLPPVPLLLLVSFRVCKANSLYITCTCAGVRIAPSPQNLFKSRHNKRLPYIC